MSLFAQDDLLAKEMESWKAFSESLRQGERAVFEKMLHDCYKHLNAINAKGEPYTTHSVLLSLILSQQQMIDFLISRKK